jgi:hypothetical protein
MSIRELKQLLDQVPDTRELVLRARGRAADWSVAYDAWCDACDDTVEALVAWRRWPGRDRYATYRAAQDREDAAQEALASTALARV